MTDTHHSFRKSDSGSNGDSCAVNLPAMAMVRRRWLALACAVGALGWGGCGMFSMSSASKSESSADRAAATNVVTPQKAAKDAETFTAGADEAINKTYLDKLKAAADKKAQTPQVVLATSGANSPEKAAGSQLATPVSAPVPVEAPVAAPKAVAPPTTAPAPVVSAPLAAEPITADAALDAIRKQVAARPSLNTALAVALLETAEGKSRDMKIAKELSAVDQQVLQDLLSALQAMSAATPGTATVPDRAVPLVDAAKKWQQESDLRLPKIALASRVDSYGVYSAVEPKFQGGQRHTVIVYCEVANFLSQKNAEGWFETHLSQQETLATDDGLLIWRPNAEEVEDRSLNQRRDFYLVKKLVIPDNLAIGKYSLRMSVTDRNTNKIAVVSLPIEIVK